MIIETMVGLVIFSSCRMDRLLDWIDSCFANLSLMLEMPAMPDEPLIFVEVALTQGIPASVQGVLADERDKITAEEADTAVFYSISNCQAGLAGISFGNSLIKQQNIKMLAISLAMQPLDSLGIPWSSNHLLPRLHLNPSRR